MSKPVIYEHFGGKEGLYQVIVDRETKALYELLEEKVRLYLHARRLRGPSWRCWTTPRSIRTVSG